ncbi:TIGR04104 family putative zinc finger protein [Clostridium oceanicum]|uniref:Cxxc_20_cxxc protein n=1 Tax=Clostridium oceanicum TaxID=1543 RepID=A0ABP3USA9_9CLOT
MFSKKCVKCSSDLKWKTILKAVTISTGYKFECDYCKAKYSVGYISRLILMVSMLLPITIFQKYTDSIFGGWTLVVWFIWAIILNLIAPFWVSIRLEEK